ncbi:MAG: hypothetical protein CR982_09255 [Candidatus Cloacimonadota bacterium]|nr:MAG: hypothetical protein CR982_09255 [Candidatus Cloacimonadota bacterium]PIE77496.1 MAG: hypothetical protein CSA15_12545 [Candidatus Delongbacteria bacterium]
MRLKKINTLIMLLLFPMVVSVGGKDRVIFDEENEFYEIKESIIPAYFDYTVKKNSFVKIRINSLLGSEVYSFIPGIKEKGSYSSVWNIYKEGERIYGLFELQVYEDDVISNSKIIFIPQEISDNTLYADDFEDME